MKVNITRKEAEEIYRKTGIFKYRILSEMVDWRSDVNYLRGLIQDAENEYNELRSFVGEKYPVGKCKNIVELFHLLEK